MTGLPLAIPLTFVILATLLLWFIIGAKGKWWFKLAVILPFPCYGLVLWLALPSFFGWPAKEPLPEEALLLWFEVQEPLGDDVNDGALYLWVVPMPEQNVRKGTLDRFLEFFKYRPERVAPRAYELPYSREASEELNGVKERLARGEPIIIRRGEMRGRQGRDGLESQIDDFQLYDLPPPQIPKDTQP